MIMDARKELAKQAMGTGEFPLRKGETTEAKESTLIQLYVNNMTTYCQIEGVRIERAPRPLKVVPIKEEEEAPKVKKMFLVTTLVDGNGHYFPNPIILN